MVETAPKLPYEVNFLLKLELLQTKFGLVKYEIKKE
jgi:hypothetical protein